MTLFSLFQLPCFNDIIRRKPSSTENVTILDGVRGIAALIVLADHTKLAPFASGINGVWLFFTLSGYLLTLPFIHNATYTRQWVATYMMRRLLRILPMYIVYVTIASCYFSLLNNEWLIKQLTFQLSTGHLWSIKQELTFYLILPLILPLMALLHASPAKKALLLLLIAYLAAVFLTEDIFSLTSSVAGTYQPFYLTPFLTGMAAAYAMDGIKKSQQRVSPYLAPLGGIFFLALFLFLNLDTAVNAVLRGETFPILHPWITGLCCAAFIMWVQLIPKGVGYRLINALPLRAIGVVGYSFYLLHWMVKEWFIPYAVTPWLYFTLTCITTYALSCITYSLIEKPCMELLNTKKRKFHLQEQTVQG